MKFKDSHQWFWTDAVICTITFVFQSLLFTLHCMVSYAKPINIPCCIRRCFSLHDGTEQNSKTVTFCTLLALFFYVIYGLDVLMTRIDSLYGYLTLSCNLTVRIGTISYQLSKGFIYCVFVLRVKLAFDGSKYSYSSTLISVLINLIALNTIINVFCGCIFVFGNKHFIQIPRADDAYDELFYVCHTEINLFFIGYMVLIDVLFTVICMYLFIKPLRNIIKTNEQHEVPSNSPSEKVQSTQCFGGDTCTSGPVQMDMPALPDPVSLRSKRSGTMEITDEFRDLVTKYTIITSVGLLSTFCGLVIIGITDCPAFNMMDVWINSICLVLMCKKYESFYRVLCCGLIHCVHSKTMIKELIVNNTKVEIEIKKTTKKETATLSPPNLNKIIKSVSLTNAGQGSHSLSLIDEYNEHQKPDMISNT